MPTSPKDILPGMFIYAKVWIIVQHYDINAAFWMEKKFFVPVALITALSA